MQATRSAERKSDLGSDHFVQFYEDEGRLADAIANFVAASLQDGGGGVVIATPRHRTPVMQRLSRRGLDLKKLQEEGRWASLDAEEALDKFMVDGLPDEDRFRGMIEPVLDRAAQQERQPRVRAFGEMVAVLWEKGNREGALHLERLWNEILKQRSLSLFCAYPLRAFGGESAAQQFLEICGEHEHVLPSEDYTRLQTQEERHRLVLQLQQKAVALDVEVARRKELEDLLRRRENELYAYLEGASEAVVDVEPDGAIRWGNGAFLSLLGVDAVEGQSLKAALVDGGAFDDIWAKMLRGEDVGGRAVEIRDAHGRNERARIRLGVLRAAGRAVHMRWFLECRAS
jgi:PAS domain-containing protein